MNETNEMYDENEKKANYYAAYALLAASVIDVIGCILNYFGMFGIDKTIMLILTLFTFFEMIMSAVVTFYFKGNKKWIKYVLLFSVTVFASSYFAVLGSSVVLLVIFPILLSCLYYSERLTMYTVAITIVCLFFAHYFNVYHGIADYNMVKFVEGTILSLPDGELNLEETIKGTLDYRQTFLDTLQYGFFPQVLIIIILGPTFYRISIRARQLVNEQKEIVQKTQRIEAELSVAEKIQEAMLPKILPTYPNREEFNIYASMDTAKEVGGDFYDFFFADKEHFVIVIADVSGKGVPASMFMAVTKTLIKNRMQSGLDPAEAFYEVNKQINDGNDENMFVTAWMAAIDLSTGNIKYANAGHNPPLILKGGQYSYLKQKPNIILGALSGAKYKDYESKLETGDKIFLYTDGVTEAMNMAGDQYSEERLLETLNAHKLFTVEETIGVIREDVKLHVGEAEQSDDITMLSLQWNGTKSI